MTTDKINESRESQIVSAFDHQLDEISLHVHAISNTAARETREGKDIRAVDSLTERAIETFEVMLDELLIAALGANVSVRRTLQEDAEERVDSR